MAKKPDLQSAYGLTSSTEMRRLYADWAGSYDQDFADAHGYRLPQLVAECYLGLGGHGPVLDVGAGTGLVGRQLSERGVGPIDGTDLSVEMLEVASRSGAYRSLFAGDVTGRLDVADGAYAGAVSAGTFTNAHVGPAALAEVLRMVAPGGWVVVSVNALHWARADFDGNLERMAALHDHMEREDVAIYAEGSTGEHAGDRAWLLRLRRAGAVSP